MTEPGNVDRARRLEEQIAFMERELEHHKEQIADLWVALEKARSHIARLERRIEHEPCDDT